MFIVSPATRNRKPFAAVVPLEDIVQGIHLVPKFGTEVSKDWSRENIFDKCTKFYVNHWINLHTFLRFER